MQKRFRIWGYPLGDLISVEDVLRVKHIGDTETIEQARKLKGVAELLWQRVEIFDGDFQVQ